MLYALIDWDNTIHQGYTIYGLADHLLERGIITEQLLISFRKLEKLYWDKEISYATYTDRTCQAFAHALRGCSTTHYFAAIESYRTINKDNIYKHAQHLFQLLEKYHIHPYLVSGAPYDVLRTYTDQFGLKDIFAFQLEMNNNRITGKISCNYGFNKEQILTHSRFQGSEAIHLLTMGDAVADIPLLNNSLIPIVVGKEELALRVGHKKIHFTHDEKWNLQLLEARIKQAIESIS
jgi:phosphoserine phosphatase